MDDILHAMRGQAWQRAQGELRAMLETYFPTYGVSSERVENGFDAMATAIEEAIEKISGLP